MSMKRILCLSLALCCLVLPKAVLGQNCFTNTTVIANMEANVQDLSVRRVYELCANSVIETGVLDAMGIAGLFPLAVSANATVKCGPDGSRSNNCTIAFGDIGIFLSPFTGAQLNAGFLNADGIVYQGITVSDIRRGPVRGQLVTGNVLFSDCAFLVRNPNWILLRRGSQPHGKPFFFCCCTELSK